MGFSLPSIQRIGLVSSAQAPELGCQETQAAGQLHLGALGVLGAFGGAVKLGESMENLWKICGSYGLIWWLICS